MLAQPKILCIVRIGNNQSCSNWIFDNKLLARMTLVLSRFQPLKFEIPSHPSILHHEYKGGKWEGIYNYFNENPSSLKDYDYFFFPDDDIESSAENIINFVNICNEYKLQLAQPALTHDSAYSHKLTIQRPRFKFRYTDYVELMIPYMSKSTLIQCLPFFENRVYGWGLDTIWGQFVRNPNNDVGIIDASPVGHYRPLAGNNTTDKKAITARENMFAEYTLFKKEYEVKLSEFAMTSAMTHGNNHLKYGLRLLLMNILSIKMLPKMTHPKSNNLLRSYKLSKLEIKPNTEIEFSKEKINGFINSFYEKNKIFISQ